LLAHAFIGRRFFLIPDIKAQRHGGLDALAGPDPCQQLVVDRERSFAIDALNIRQGMTLCRGIPAVQGHRLPGPVQERADFYVTVFKQYLVPVGRADSSP